MRMNIIYYISLMLVIYTSSASSVSNSTYDNMKTGISHLNKAGNDFFNLIRTPLDPNHINIDDFKNFTMSLEQLSKGANYYLCYYILFVVGVAFAVLIPLVGLLIICCCCCKRCGAKNTPMDPPNARCKIIVYGLVLAILVTGMLFGTIMCFFNNQIVHETVNNQDKSINIFVNLKTNVQNVKQALIEIKDSINKAPDLRIDTHQLQEQSNNLDDSIEGFYKRLVSVPEMMHVIDQTKSLKSVLERHNVEKSRILVQNLNDRLGNMTTKLKTLKSTIKDHLINCTTEECNNVRSKTDRLQLNNVDQTIIDKLTATLYALKSIDFQTGLLKIIDFKESNPVNMKLILAGELKYIRDHLNNKSFSDSLKQLITDAVDRIIRLEQIVEDNIPSLLTNETTQHNHYNSIRNYETYRYYVYIGLCAVVCTIIVCYYLGLLFGTFGERPTEDAGCCNRGVGARFMTSAVVLTFLISSIIMVVVIANMLTTGIVHTDVCRYTALKNENEAKVLDVYVSVALNLTNTRKAPQGIVNALFNNCPHQSFYRAFSQVYRPLIIQHLEPYFKSIDDKIVSLILNQINLTAYLNTNPFVQTSSIDLSSMVNSISLFTDDTHMSAYLNELSRVTRDNPGDVIAMNSLNDEVGNLKTSLGLLVQYLNNSENEYIRWKIIGQLFDNNKMDFVTSKSSELRPTIRKIVVDFLDTAFTSMFKDVSCLHLSSTAKDLFKTICHDAIDPLNGTWYGLGFYLLLCIPVLVFACLLIGIYRRISKYYPDKDEPDYENYIGFYARSDSESFKKNNANKKSSQKGYKPIPLQTMS